MFERNSHLTLAKKRINEMNKALASVERMAKKLQPGRKARS